MALGPSFESVLAAAQAGEGWAFARLHGDLAGVVTGYLRLQGAVEPEDVASETFLSVFRGLSSFTGDEESFRSWVFTIAHRRLVDERRRGSRRPVTVAFSDRFDDEPSVEGPEDAVLEDLHSAEILTLLDELSDAQRDVLLLRIVAGMSIEETADAVGRRGGAVKQLQRRGLAKLEKILRGG